MMKHMLIATALLVFPAALTLAQTANIATLRGDTELMEQPEPPTFPKVDNRDIKKKRNYPAQPPTIPHKIRGYQIDLNSNKCLSCHSRGATEDSQAPMISITHFMDRDGQFLASISPRRYFCNLCHVPQYEIKPLVGNDFVDVDDILSERSGADRK